MPTTHASTPSALELIWRRKSTGSMPGKRRDGCKLALVVEGGGMRGCIAAGMGAAISRLRYLNCFDQLIGTSAGALGLPYLLADQAVADAPIYAEDLAKGRFISTWRAFHSNRTIMDLDYLFDDVFENQRPLRFDVIKQSAIELGIVATRVSTGEAVLLNRFQRKSSLMKAMRASALIPGVGGHSAVELQRQNKKHRLIDGGYSAFLPEEIARQNGATHLMVLTNLPDGLFHQEPGYNHVRIVGAALSRLNCPVAKTFSRDHIQANEQLARIREGKDASIAHCEIPAHGPYIDTLCKKRHVMWQGLEAGFKAMCCLLDHPDEPIPDEWTNLKNAKK